MKKVKGTLETILADIEEKLPALLENQGIRQFDGYSIGFPADPEKLLLCVWFASMGDDVNTTLEFDLHAQFPGMQEADVYSYIDAVNSYLGGFDPNIIGYTGGAYSVIAHDNPHTAMVEIFWNVKLTYSKDDCDL